MIYYHISESRKSQLHIQVYLKIIYNDLYSILWHLYNAKMMSENEAIFWVSQRMPITGLESSLTKLTI